jgi:starch synthase
MEKSVLFDKHFAEIQDRDNQGPRLAVLNADPNLQRPAPEASALNEPANRTDAKSNSGEKARISRLPQITVCPKAPSMVQSAGPMTVLFAASEIAPEASTGGLGEVLAALPRYVGASAQDGHEVAVALPGYPALMEDATPLEVNFSISIGDSLQPVTVFERTHDDGTQLLLIHNEALFGRPGIYGDSHSAYPDNALRFIFFSRAVVELAKRMSPSPQIIHAHDWQTALVPTLVKDQNLPIKTVLTLHNIAYQGSFGACDFAYTNLPHHWMTPSGLEFYGSMNLLKGGILAADILTTVSEVYRREILTPEGGCGLHEVLKQRASDLYAVPNGVDPERWSPEPGHTLAAPFSAKSPEGKKTCKAKLLNELNLLPAPKGVVFAMMGRLADQKGFDLLLPLLPRLLSSDARLIIAGDGEATLRADLLIACRQHPHKLAFLPRWDASFPQRLFAGSDVLLVPSHFEPCGLAPLQALRFGCVPLAHATGGLLENLADFQPGTGSGNALLYYRDSGSALWDAIVRAKHLFQDQTTAQRLLQNALLSEFPWQRAVSALEPLYRRLAHS